MPRLKLLFVLFALLVLGPAAVLVQYGRRFLATEEQRLRAEVEGERARAIDSVEAEIRAAVGRVEAVEAQRPWYQYRSRFVPPDLYSNTVAYVPSPIAGTPPDPLVRDYFEWAPGRPTLTSPSHGAAESKDDQQAADDALKQAYHVVELDKVARPRLEDIYARRAALFPGPADEAVTTKFLLQCNIEDSNDNVTAIEAVKKGDLSVQKRLGIEWEQHQAAQSKARKVYQEEKLRNAAANNDRQVVGSSSFGQQADESAGQQLALNPAPQIAQKVQEAEPLAAPVRTYPIRYLWAGAHLVAVRLVDLDGMLLLQGYELDLDRLRTLAHASLERLGAGLAQATAIDLAPEARDVFVLRSLAAAPIDVSLLTAPTRRLLYASAALIFILATAGLAILYGIVRGHVELARRRTDFVAAVSHELKAPLTAIRALAEMLSLGIVPTREKETEYFGHIRGESERLSRLITNVLDLARLERKERRYELAPGDAGDVVRVLAETWTPNLASRGFEFKVEVAPDLPTVRFERDALEQVVSNLLDNAVKYTMPCETKRIALRARAAAGSVVIEVEDSGIGISDEDRGRLFRRFARGSAPLARGTGGAGLGLAIAKEHVDAHGGRIEVESAPGKGSTFRVVLPSQ